MIRSVCTAFVNAPLFRRRTPEAQLLWFKLYMHPAQHLCGLFVLDLGGMAHCTALDMGRAGAAFGELLQTGLCETDTAQDLVWLPEMSNQCKSMTKAKGTVYTAVDKYINSLGRSPLCLRVCDTLGIPYRYPIDTLLSGSGVGTDSGSGPGGSKDPGVPRSVETAAPLQLALVGDRAKSEKPTRAKRAPKAASEETVAGRLVWSAYEAAYEARYQRLPKRNAWVGNDLQKLIKNVGADDAVKIAGYYPTTNHQFYVKNWHAFRFMVTDYEKLLGELETGRVVTETTARANEKTASNPVFEILRERERQRGRGVIDHEES